MISVSLALINHIYMCMYIDSIVSSQDQLRLDLTVSDP